MKPRRTHAPCVLDMNPSDPCVPPCPVLDAPDARVSAEPWRLVPERLADLGLDVEIGLRCCGGKPALYRRLLEIFRTDHLCTFEERWTAGCLSGDSRAVARLVHTFKGVCLSVGAVSLGRQAQALEAALAGADAGAVERLAEVVLRGLAPLRNELGYALVDHTATGRGCGAPAALSKESA